MSKFDYRAIIEKRKAEAKKGDELTVTTGDEIPVVSTDPKDFVVMPEWWKSSYGVIGVPFGRIIQVAGESDSGKTRLALEIMKKAQEQGIGIVYLETEDKTTADDFLAVGLDPEAVMMDHDTVTEYAWAKIYAMVDSFFEAYPNDRLLVVFDSYGNTSSLHDEQIDIIKDSQKPGGHAKTNRLAISQLKTRMAKYPIAAVVVNYTYDLIGSVGKSNAGGKALNFHSSLIIQTIRKGWVDKQRQGVKVRAGALMKWSTVKNHLCKGVYGQDGKPMPKEIEVEITSDGIALKGASGDD